MTTEAIVESGMTFGPYPDGHCFYIEKSECYKSIAEGVKVAEFMLLRSKSKEAADIWIVEAKSSSPMPSNLEDFETFITDILDKLSNAFMLGIAMCLKRHPTFRAELPSFLREVDLSNAKFKLVLMINGHREEWLPPLQDALSLALKPLLKLWALPCNAVVVLNPGTAKNYGLIREDIR